MLMLNRRMICNNSGIHFYLSPLKRLGSCAVQRRMLSFWIELSPIWPGCLNENSTYRNSWWNGLDKEPPALWNVLNIATFKVLGSSHIANPKKEKWKLVESVGQGPSVGMKNATERNKWDLDFPRNWITRWCLGHSCSMSSWFYFLVKRDGWWSFFFITSLRISRS